MTSYPALAFLTCGRNGEKCPGVTSRALLQWTQPLPLYSYPPSHASPQSSPWSRHHRVRLFALWDGVMKWRWWGGNAGRILAERIDHSQSNSVYRGHSVMCKHTRNRWPHRQSSPYGSYLPTDSVGGRLKLLVYQCPLGMMSIAVEASYGLNNH